MQGDRLLARAEELLARAGEGELCFTSFLTPGEMQQLKRHFAFCSKEWLFFGGYDGAERQRMAFLPPYLAEAQEPFRSEWMSEALAPLAVPLLVRGSGWHTLCHRDFLGAVMKLGIERDAIGDVCVLNSREALLFCDQRMVTFLSEELTHVAGDTVKASPTTLPEGFDGARRFEPLYDTVASPRADGIVSALCRVSRATAADLIKKGLVFVCDEMLCKPDAPLQEGFVVRIRGYGKFIIRSLSEKTKKGNLRLHADRYV